MSDVEIENLQGTDFGVEGDLITELTQDWWNRLLKGMNKILCAPGEKSSDHTRDWPRLACEGPADMTLKDDLSRSVGAQYSTGEEQRNKSRNNEETEPKQKQHPVVDVTGDGSMVWCYEEQYCIRTWNVRSMNQGKLEAVK